MTLRNWRGPEFERLMEAEIKRRLFRAVLTVERHAKQLLSVAGTGTRSKAGGVQPTAKGSRKKRIYGAFPSAPGEPPHKQTGRLRASVTHEVDENTGRVGTNVKYGRWLELGTRNMAPRPWLKRSLDEMRAMVKAILTAPWKPPE
jgi:phage gpG-like protein